MKRTLMAMVLAVVMAIGSFTLTSTPVYAADTDGSEIDTSDSIIPSVDELDMDEAEMIRSQMLNIDQIKGLSRSKSHKKDTFYISAIVKECSSTVNGEDSYNYITIEVVNLNLDTGEVIDFGEAVLYIPDEYVGALYPDDMLLVKAKLNTKLHGDYPVLNSIDVYMY